MQARFAAGTFARINTVLIPGEERTDFVRKAVEAELGRRERKAAKDRRPARQTETRDEEDAVRFDA